MPSVGLTGFSGLGDTTPSDTINQTFTLSDFVSWSHKRHNMRYGLDFHRIHADSIGGTNVLGSFTFSGFATENPGAAGLSELHELRPERLVDCGLPDRAAAADAGHGGAEQDLSARELVGLVCAG